jgi:hypothetical protein
MTAHGYDRNLLLKQLDGFSLTFAEQQLTVFKLTIRGGLLADNTVLFSP